MYLQEAFEAFLNTNELTSSDQIDLYFDNFVSAFSTCIYKYAPLKRASRKKRKHLASNRLKTQNRHLSFQDTVLLQGFALVFQRLSLHIFEAISITHLSLVTAPTKCQNVLSLLFSVDIKTKFNSYY